MNTTQQTQTRYSPEYTCHSERFCIKRKAFNNQYFNIYTQRSRVLRKPLENAARIKWNITTTVAATSTTTSNENASTAMNIDSGNQSNPSEPIKIMRKVLDAKLDELCVLIGTLYKDMPLKPCVLDEVAKDATSALPFLTTLSRYTSDKDVLVLEDSSGRIPLKGVVDVSRVELCTGVGIAVLGRATAGGQFVVEDWTLSGLAPQVPRPLHLADMYVALMSGMDFGAPDANPMRNQLAADWLMGLCGSATDIRLSSKVVRVVLAGNNLCDPAKLAQADTLKVWTRKRVSGLETSQIHHALDAMDTWVAGVSSFVSVDVMSGPRDPTNRALPQQPLHPCMFPRASCIKHFCCVTNPYDFDLDGVRLLGTSGQAVSDVCASVNSDDVVSILAQDMLGRHIAPTAPDTLPSFPFVHHDPFVVDSCPHIYFVGNQPRFAHKRIVATTAGKIDNNTSNTTNCDSSKSVGHEVSIVCVPEFSSTGQLVLVSLRTGDCQLVSFCPQS